MKRIPFTSTRHWLLIFVFSLLVLSACERPVPRDDTSEPPDAAPTIDPLIIPTALPTVDNSDVGSAGDAYPAGETTGDTAVSNGTADTTGYPAPETSADTAPETGAETTPEQETVAAGGEVVHVVQSGETLGYIAELYDVSVADIAAANGITNLDSLDVGQELIIKAGAAAEGGDETTTDDGAVEQVHVVQAGENLFRIGLRYGFTPEELAAYNNIPDVTRIDVGQIIKIPPK